MRLLRRLALVSILGVFGASTLACGNSHLHPLTAQERANLDGLAAKVADGTGDAQAVAALRAGGPDGLVALTKVLDASANDPARVARLRPAIDEVAQQKDAHVSRLYWYTDLEQAEAAARASGKPILSLRLLGNLDDELSCANSRFFRTTLYPNAGVSSYLRDHYVLHWSSERPAPVMTIDFRDGRKIQRTITGNSIHYVLDEDGRPLDAIPGLYGPVAFVDALVKAEDLAHRTRNMSASDREQAVARFHQGELAMLEGKWRGMLVSAGVTDPAMFALPSPPPTSKAPPAAVAAPIAYAKAAVEMPMVRGVMPSMLLPEDKLPWAKLVAPFAGSVALDANARALVRAKNPMDWSNPEGPRPLDDAAFAKLITSFEQLMVEDGVRNEFKNHAKLHEWFIDAPGTSFTDLNRRVYSELFLTPKSDPWLGLVPPGVYSGIENDGVMGK